MAEMPHTVEVEIQANFKVVRPGDTLIIAIANPPNRPLSDEEFHYIDQRIKEMLPEGIKAVIIPEAEMVVYRPDGTQGNDGGPAGEASQGDSTERMGHGLRDAEGTLPG